MNLSEENYDRLPFVPAVSDTENFVKAPEDYLILCDGNSITRHNTDADIAARLGWKIVAGMAASAECNDYAHLLAGRIQQCLPGKRVKLLFTTRQILTDIEPDLVIIQGGEHCLIEDLEDYRREYLDMIRSYRQRLGDKVQIILISIWNPVCREEFFECTGKNYQENALKIREMQRECADLCGVKFADMAELENIPENTGCGQIAAVRWHPSDAGMKAISEKVFALWQLPQQ